MNIAMQKSSLINADFYHFINDEVLPESALEQQKFWDDLNQLVSDFAPKNRALLTIRTEMQTSIDQWHKSRQGQQINQQEYQGFLKQIGYLVAPGDDFTISTENVDKEIAELAGPQLVVPVNNARFAINAANARWGSLYDALYGTDIIPKNSGLQAGKKHNQARGNHVIAYAKEFLDQTFPLSNGSHKDVTSYMVYYKHLLAIFPDGSSCGLEKSSQFVALSGHKSEPTSLVLLNNGLHIIIEIDRQGPNGVRDLAGIDDIQVEAALTTIMDFEDSVAAVDSDDKIAVYRNWLGLMQGKLSTSFDKNGCTLVRQLNRDKIYTHKDGSDHALHGRSLLLARTVGHLMDTELVCDHQGNHAPEGIVDTVVTALIGTLDLSKSKNCSLSNSRSGSIYIVKPKMHGPDEVKFTCELFDAVEDMLGLKRNTIKLGIMDEERRTTVNLKACIRMARQRLVFINTGFLDRTGDEIHTSMHAGPVAPKAQLKQQTWLQAYEKWNVDIGLACGLPGKAQIGKGMWAMPDEMAKMMTEKVAHPAAGASTAWVPSPSAATLHALHYHQVDVFAVQQQLAKREPACLSDLLSVEVMTRQQRSALSVADVERELENNLQGILGYVVRWIDLGSGCSKVPDINNIGLMEDRATLRISSQHIANWLLHGIATKAQVEGIMARMASIVDLQNEKVKGYQAMATDLDNSLAIAASKALIFSAQEQSNGYTEPMLHHYRLLAKSSQ
jgi:malate synthase